MSEIKELDIETRSGQDISISDQDTSIMEEDLRYLDAIMFALDTDNTKIWKELHRARKRTAQALGKETH